MLGNFNVDLPPLAVSIRRIREMANSMSGEIARGAANSQHPHPYVTPSYHEHPCLPRQTAHVHALAAWRAKNRGTRQQAIDFQMWIHRHYRFAFAREMRRAWSQFGGIASRLNRIAALPSIATLEIGGCDILYRDLLGGTLADFAGARFTSDYHTALSDVREDTRREVARENGPNTDPPPAVDISQRQQKGNQRS